jgi:hypothetical protein
MCSVIDEDTHIIPIQPQDVKQAKTSLTHTAAQVIILIKIYKTAQKIVHFMHGLKCVRWMLSSPIWMKQW